MSDKRAFSSRVRWAEAECDAIRTLYPLAAWPVILAALPGRTKRVIQCKAHGMAVVRIVAPKRSAQQVREAKRLHMERKRAANPEAVREQQRQWATENRERINAKRREQHKTRMFWTRALGIKGVSAGDLARLWKQQRGRCALTGIRLDRTAELDHKIPRARGGSDALANLQWVSHAANRAKRDLTDDEFYALCQQAVRWIGQRIAMVDSLQLRRAA